MEFVLKLARIGANGAYEIKAFLLDVSVAVINISKIVSVNFNVDLAFDVGFGFGI